MEHSKSCSSFSRFSSIYRPFWISQTIPVSFSSIKKKGIVSEGVKGPEDHESLTPCMYVIMPWNYAGPPPFPILLFQLQDHYRGIFQAVFTGNNKKYCGWPTLVTCLDLSQSQHWKSYILGNLSVTGKLEKLVTPYSH